jgi:hypothetical protein
MRSWGTRMGYILYRSVFTPTPFGADPEHSDACISPVHRPTNTSQTHYKLSYGQIYPSRSPMPIRI